jgi:thiamine kinase-like enzyme
MASTEPDHDALLALLPQTKLGAVTRIESLTAGLSGAQVYAVTTASGHYVLRIQARQLDAGYFAQQLRILRRASAAGLAPALVHVDEAARATVSVRIAGQPLGVALADPQQRGAVLGAVVGRLSQLHQLDTSEVEPRDPMPFVRAAYEAARFRPGYPPWAAALEPLLDELSLSLEGDARRVICHNDVNPGNVLWDGSQPWLVDWEVAGLGHPHYDLATLATFLQLDERALFELAALHDGAVLDASARARLLGLRRLVGLLTGLTFLGLVDDLNVRPCVTRQAAPSLGDCYAALRRGEYSMRSPYGAASMGLALLALGCG